MVIKTNSEESLILQSIQEWAETPTPDHARALIRLYKESEWRSTRIEVLRSLGRFQDTRSLQFLIEVAEKKEDITEQQLAYLAIGQRKNKSAQIYIQNSYLNAPDTLKAHLAYALGQAQGFTAIPILLNDWDLAYQKQEWLWLRNIILSLGDLKAYVALPKLRILLSKSNALPNELCFALLFTAARLEREPELLLPLERQFSEDSLLLQVYQSTLSQVQIRSQFKLEDYLDKIFSATEPHPILPLELGAFEVSQVEIGFSVFDLEKDWKRFLFALQGLEASKRITVIEKMLPLLEDEDSILYFLNGVSGLIEASNQASIIRILGGFSKTKEPIVKLKWLECVAPFIEISDFAKEFLNQSDLSLAIQYLNLWSEWTLIGLAKKENKEKAVKGVQSWLKGDELPLPVLARLMRACSELDLPVKELAAQFALRFKEVTIRSSLLMFMERFPQFFEVKTVLKELATLSQVELENLGPRILAVFEAYSLAKIEIKLDAKWNAILKAYAEHESAELKVCPSGNLMSSIRLR